MNNLALVYDTETTGLPDWHQPSSAPHQPHLVELAAVLVDLETRAPTQGINVIIRPENWEIPMEVSDIHGTTHEYALEVGVPEFLAVDMLIELWGSAQFRIAHNESFDARIIRIALKRDEENNVLADKWKDGTAACTARLAAPILDLPPTERMVAAGRNHAKTPNLKEAYEFFTGKPFKGAHRATADCLACLEVYWAIQDRRAA